MRAAWLLAGLPIVLATSGCDSFRSREFIECRDGLLAKLKAPSTFKMIKSERTYMGTETPPAVWVSIEYDAQNSYGAMLRDTEICQYPATANEQVDWAKIDRDRDAETDRIMKEYEASKKASATPTTAPTEKPEAERLPDVDTGGVDSRSPTDEANLKRYGTTDPDGGE